ncbi:MAG: O-antigen ligase family protein [Anaerolineae bacterium]|nr:O-antigen ligase family protein [Anaerolineae bacterium]
MVIERLKFGLARSAEALLLTGIILAHWFPDPARLNVIILFLPILCLRFALTRRLLTRTPLDVLLLAFLILCILNSYTAPYTWGFYVVSRAAMGVGIVWVVGDWGRPPRADRGFVIGWLAFGILIGVVSLFTAQYTIKSIELQPILDLLPRLRDLPLVQGGFNVNEISGAMTLLVVPAAAFALTQQIDLPRRWRLLAWAALVTLSLALLLAQSRFAIFGVLAACGMVIFGVLLPGRRRRFALAILLILTAVEVILAGNWIIPENASESALLRDENSQISRLNIWGSALAILRDHPLTGVGINQFRARPVRDQYPVPGYEQQVLPHAHNILLQTGSDLGLPGMLVYVGWNAALALMLWRTWKRGGGWARTGAVGAAAGLLAHFAFDSGDAITLFDRFIFSYWLLVGFAAALYIGVREEGNVAGAQVAPDRHPLL